MVRVTHLLTVMACAVTACAVTACTASDDIIANCDAADRSKPGAVATVDQAPWATDSMDFVWSGESLQLVSDTVDGVRISLVLQQTVDGLTPSEADTPMIFDLTNGAFALLYPESESSLTSNNGSGEAFITLLSSDRVAACFEFSAVSGDGSQSSTVSSGRLLASPL